jgi:hypothetical protein
MDVDYVGADKGLAAGYAALCSKRGAMANKPCHGSMSRPTAWLKRRPRTCGALEGQNDKG